MTDLHYFRPDWIEPTDRLLQVDVCVYGATSGGIVAAIAAKRLGLSVALLQPGKFVGGLTTGGLGETDYGKQHVIGGMAREFYRRVGKHYGREEEWHFEPSAAQRVFADWLKEADVTPQLCQYLDGVTRADNRITEISMTSGLRVKGRIFLDCSYEGDLLAKAGCSYHLGREDNSVYGETINGIQVHAKHQFGPGSVDPYVRPGDPSSGLLPFVEPIDLKKKQGEDDRRIQAYCFRICMTNDPALRIDWPKPEIYHESWYELALRYYVTEKDGFNEPELPPEPGTKHRLRKMDLLTQLTPGGFRKTDTNNHGAVSSDFIGGNWEWPEASYARREELFQRHIQWQQGFYWTMANNASIPNRYRDAYKTWGLCRDEFLTTGGWSHTLYVREGRRMVSDYVLTERDCMHLTACDDPVGMGSYALDSHNTTRFVTLGLDGKPTVMNEGDVQRQPAGPYGISYRSIVPHAAECGNLLVPVCCAASHIAFGSVRMEPVFMVLGESAAHAAALAIKSQLAVQEVPYAKLVEHLRDSKQVIGDV